MKQNKKKQSRPSSAMGSARLEDLCEADRNKICSLVNKLCATKNNKEKLTEQARREKELLLDRIYRLQEQK